MGRKGMALVEIMVGMVILAIASLGVTATIVMISGKEMRSAGGGSLDIQALGYARETLELLRNAVSTDATHAAPLSLGNHTTGAYTTDTLPAAFKNAPINGTRTYLVSSVAGTDLKQVKVTVLWTD